MVYFVVNEFEQPGMQSHVLGKNNPRYKHWIEEEGKKQELETTEV